jgi:hypothetical protein
MHVHVPPISGPSLLSKCTVEVQAPVASFSGAKSVLWVLRLCQAYAVEMAVKDLPQVHCPMIPVCTRGGAWWTCFATARTVDSAGHACGVGDGQSGRSMLLIQDSGGLQDPGPRAPSTHLALIISVLESGGKVVLADAGAWQS